MAVYASDSFALGTQGQDLVTHGMDSGGPWSRHPLFGGQFIFPYLSPYYAGGPGVRVTTGLGGVEPLYVAQAVAGQPSYQVSVAVTSIADTVLDAQAGVAAEVNVAARTAYLALLDYASPPMFRLVKLVAGVRTELGSSVGFVEHGNTQQIRLVIDTGYQGLQVYDGVHWNTLITTHDTSIPASGVAGLYGQYEQYTYGALLTNWQAETIPSTSGGGGGLVPHLSVNGPRATMDAAGNYLLRSGSCRLARVLTSGSVGLVTCYDGVDNTGVVVYAETPVSGKPVQLEIPCSTGLFVTLAASGPTEIIVG